MPFILFVKLFYRFFWNQNQLGNQTLKKNLFGLDYNKWIYFSFKRGLSGIIANVQDCGHKQSEFELQSRY